MEWLVRLEGDEWSLEDLPKWFSRLDHKVRLEDGKYYLTSVAFEHCTTPAAVWEMTDQIVERINGATRAFEPLFRPIQVGTELVQVQDDGTRLVHHRLQPDPKEYRLKAGIEVVATGGRPAPPQPSRPEELVAEWEDKGHESDLGRALRIGLLPQQTWGSLYHVYEIIKHDKSKGTDDWKALLPLLPNEPDLGRELKRFRDTANDPKHAGIHARHGKPPKPKGKPAPRMTWADAQSLIDQLLVAWLLSKI
jgi:hypothetical protein